MRTWLASQLIWYQNTEGAGDTQPVLAAHFVWEEHRILSSEAVLSDGAKRGLQCKRKSGAS
jgi:hypothetical protein